MNSSAAISSAAISSAALLEALPMAEAAGTVIGVASFRTDQFSFFEGVGHGRIEQLMQEVA